MRVAIFGLLALSVGLSSAAPAPGKNDPPGPPSRSLGQVKQQCSASQSSISCCNSNGGGPGGPGKSKSVYWPSGSNNYACDQILGHDDNKNVQNICSTIVACCIGDGCIAIAE